jgi:hypothetical protein
MAIPIYRQQITVEGVLLEVVTDQHCRWCDRIYADLRVEPFRLTRSGMPAPFVAPSWGEAERREQITDDLAALVQHRQAYGIGPLFGATRCPYCRRGLRAERDPISVSFPLSVVVNFMAWLFGLLGPRPEAANMPSATAPSNAATADQWRDIREAAGTLGVEPAALWFAAGKVTTRSLEIDDPKWTQERVHNYLRQRRVLWIRTNTPQPSADLSAEPPIDRGGPASHSQEAQGGAAPTGASPPPAQQRYIPRQPKWPDDD